MTRRLLASGIIALALLGAGFGAYTVDKRMEIKDLRINQLEKQTEELQQSLTKSIQKANSLEKEKEEVAGTSASLYLKAEIFRKAILDLDGNITKLDQLILKDDKRNVEAVEWYTDHGDFTVADGELSEARLRYREWKEKQSLSDEEYREIKGRMQKNINEFTTQMETWSQLDFSTPSETTQTN